VVRLKGGDPLIFGRIGEEIAALRQANIEFEIVPGITAALGAASSAQIPLTHRSSSHALVFLTGHSATGADCTDWRALVSLGATVAIYMPSHHYSEISRKLRSAGLADETPCAIISRATTTPTLLLVGEALRNFCSAGIPSAALRAGLPAVGTAALQTVRLGEEPRA
jgi:siroheme synthase